MTVEMEMDGADGASVAFHRSLIRSDRRLTYGEVDELFAGRSRAEEPWGEPLGDRARGRGRAARAARQRGSLEVESFEPSFEFDDGGDVRACATRRRPSRTALIEQLMILANEQVAATWPSAAADALPRARAARPAVGQLLVEQLAALDVPTPPLPKQMTPQQAADAVGEISRMVADYVRAHGHGRRVPVARAARAQAGLLLAAEPRPRRAGERALLPLHLADPPLSGPRGAPRACCRRSAWTRRAAARGDGGGRRCSSPPSAARCRSSATPTTSAWPSCSSARWPRRPRGAPSSRARSSALIGAGAFVQLRRGGLRGLPAGPAAARRWWT